MAQKQAARMGATEAVSVRVLETVAEREGVDPIELAPPLYEAIETEALEALFSDSIYGERQHGVNLVFTYCGYEISIGGDGEVEIFNE